MYCRWEYVDLKQLFNCLSATLCHILEEFLIELCLDARHSKFKRLPPPVEIQNLGEKTHPSKS